MYYGIYTMSGERFVKLSNFLINYLRSFLFIHPLVGQKHCVYGVVLPCVRRDLIAINQENMKEIHSNWVDVLTMK